MSEKWQQISLKLDGELAQALRDMKQSHEESVADVVIRLLKKMVRHMSPAPSVAPRGRPSAKGAAGRGAFGGGKRGKPVAPAPSAEYGGAAPGRRSAPRAAPAAEAATGAWGAPRGKRKPAGAGSRAPRRFFPAPAEGGGKVARPRQLDGAGEAPRRDFRARTDAPRPMRPSKEVGSAEGRPQRPRKAKGRRPRAT
jgi:hypothetical protein